MFTWLSGKSIFQEIRIFCLNVKHINSLRSLSNTKQGEKWLPSASMCLNGQKSPWNVKVMTICSGFPHENCISAREGAPLQQDYKAALFHFPRSCVYGTDSVSFVSKCLFTGLPVINYGKQIFLNYIRDAFNSCPHTSRWGTDKFFNVCTKPEAGVKYIAASIA